ncbi:NADP-dependent oxidoreductase domain-containing protein [Apodospora peruviana]|uniref:NADP-dependent oxidoreductase domain-containing protein n=1 Tax=Apodospora peruviana TaxID=516989 RepID=A0AAE0IQ42_9PEZI|nr:NADP-dependent oxidoreductase domain-containing protein [Apodospora peruviana]
MQTALQKGLSFGMSAVSGIHSGKPRWADHALAGKNILPESFCLDTKARVKFQSSTGHTIDASYHWNENELPAVKEAWKTLYDAGIDLINTAEAYANGGSEAIVGKLVAGLPRDSFVRQTRWLSTPFKAANFVHPVDAAVKSLECLKLEYVDIYLVHGPIHPQSIASGAKGMAHCVEQGLARAVGVANYGQDDMLKFRDELAKYNIPLATNQCEFNMLRRHPELSELTEACRTNNIVFQSYSSPAQSRLTGKHTKENPPPKSYRFSSYDMDDIEPTLETLRAIAQKLGKSMASVALNYNIRKGALPLDAVDALEWRLAPEEMVEIDKVSVVGRITSLWQQG